MNYLEEIERNTINWLEKLLLFFKAYVLFSGGKDSLVALHLKRAAENIGAEVTALHVDTTVSTPSIVGYVRMICKYLNVKLKILRPKKDYFSLVERWGFPTATRRWCCYHLKIEPLKKFFEKNSNGPVIVFDGIRASESPRRKSFPEIGFHRHFKCLCCHTIFHWNDYHVKNYVMKYKLYVNPVYRLGLKRASECWCPVFKTPEQFLKLRDNYPDFFNMLVELESKLECKGSTMFKHGKRIYLKEISRFKYISR